MPDVLRHSVKIIAPPPPYTAVQEAVQDRFKVIFSERFQLSKIMVSILHSTRYPPHLLPLPELKRVKVSRPATQIIFAKDIIFMQDYHNSHNAGLHIRKDSCQSVKYSRQD